MLAGALALLLAGAVAAGPAVPPLDPYRLAEARREIAEVSGRFYAERTRPRDSDVPFVGVTVTLVPYADGLVAEAERVKATSRDSLQHHQGAVAAVKALVAAYELELSRAGASDLIRSDITAAEGRFAIADVPLGRWLLIARRETVQDRAWRRPSVRERDAFLPTPAVVGVRTVYLWMVPVTVKPGGAGLDLNDRAVWLTGVEDAMKAEDGQKVEDRRKAGEGKKRGTAR